MGKKQTAMEKVKALDPNLDKLDGLIEHLLSLREHKFTGYIKVNFSQGSIGRIEKFEEILKVK